MEGNDLSPWSPEPWDDDPEAWDDWPEEFAGPEYWLYKKWGLPEDYEIELL